MEKEYDARFGEESRYLLTERAAVTLRVYSGKLARKE